MSWFVVIKQGELKVLSFRQSGPPTWFRNTHSIKDKKHNCLYNILVSNWDLKLQGSLATWRRDNFNAGGALSVWKKQNMASDS